MTLFTIHISYKLLQEGLEEGKAQWASPGVRRSHLLTCSLLHQSEIEAQDIGL